MTAIIIRLVIYAVVGLAIYFGIRKIWRDWTGKFKADDQEAHRLRRERDLPNAPSPGSSISNATRTAPSAPAKRTKDRRRWRCEPRRGNMPHALRGRGHGGCPRTRTTKRSLR